jgi:hypothetical protein
LPAAKKYRNPIAQQERTAFAVRSLFYKTKSSSRQVGCRKMRPQSAAAREAENMRMPRQYLPLRRWRCKGPPTPAFCSAQPAICCGREQCYKISGGGQVAAAETNVPANRKTDQTSLSPAEIFVSARGYLLQCVMQFADKPGTQADRKCVLEKKIALV